MNEIDKYEAKALELIDGKAWTIQLHAAGYMLWCDTGVHCSECSMLEFFEAFRDDRDVGCRNYRMVAENWFQENKYPWLFL